MFKNQSVFQSTVSCGDFVEIHSGLQSWYKAYVKLKIFKIQQMQKEAFLELPLLIKCTNSLFRAASTSEKETASNPTTNGPEKKTMTARDCISKHYHKLSYLFVLLNSTVSKKQTSLQFQWKPFS
jgi:hypothetical protein